MPKRPGIGKTGEPEPIDIKPPLPTPDETAGRGLPGEGDFHLPGAGGERDPGKGGEDHGGGKGGDGDKPEGHEDPQPEVTEALKPIAPAFARRAERSDPRFGQQYQVRFHIDAWEQLKAQGWMMAEDTTSDGGHVRVELDSQYSDIEETGIDGTSDVLVTVTPHTRRHRPERDKDDQG